MQVTQVTGRFDHSTEALVLNDGQFNFSDRDGPDFFGLHSDGSAAVELLDLSNAGFDFVMPYEQAYDFNGQTFGASGVVGLASDPAAAPATAKASYSGVSSGLVGTFATQQIENFNGDATVDADFVAGVVNVTMDNLVSANSGPISAGFDRIQIDNMTIQGSGFSGGTLTTTNNGIAVNVTGSNTVTNAQGHFFGPAGVVPDEVGGTVTSAGDTRVIGALFIAD